MSITLPDISSIQKAPRWERITPVVIQSREDYIVVAERVKAVQAFIKSVEAFFKPLKESAHSLHKQICSKESDVLAPALADKATISGAMSSYEQDQERIRLIEETRLRELARVAEESRRLAEAAAREEESRRLRAEQERLMKIAEEAAAKGRNEESERALAAAAQAESESIAEQEQATQEMEEAISAPAPVVYVAKETPKVSGISYSDHWSGVCDDLAKLVKAVAEGKASISLVMVNQPSLNKRAQSDKTVFDIPGCRAVNNPTPNIRL